MRIAHVIPTLDTWYGGPVTAVLNLGAAQREIGIKVSYWATGDEKTRHSLANLPGDVRLFDAHWPQSWFRSPELAQKLNAEIDTFDLIEAHGVWPYPVWAASKIARKANIPYVICPTGTFMQPCRYETLKKRLYSHLIANRVLTNAACLHVTSEIEAKYCHEAGLKSPIAIVPNGIDPNLFEALPSTKEAEKYWPILKNRQIVLFLSRISPEKGLDQFIPAIVDLLDDHSFRDTLFVIAGPDHKGYLATVKDLLRHYDLESYVFFPGMVRGREKLALYKRADIFVLPSYSENYGIVVAEALACGTPVITTTRTPWKEVVDVDAGRWVMPERRALADALRELLEMPEEMRKAMGHRGRKLVFEKHTWKNAVRLLQTVYKCILEGKEIPTYPTPDVLGRISENHS